MILKILILINLQNVLELLKVGCYKGSRNLRISRTNGGKTCTNKTESNEVLMNLILNLINLPELARQIRKGTVQP